MYYFIVSRFTSIYLSKNHLDRVNCYVHILPNILNSVIKSKEKSQFQCKKKFLLTKKNYIGGRAIWP